MCWTAHPATFLDVSSPIATAHYKDPGLELEESRAALIVLDKKP